MKRRKAIAAVLAAVLSLVSASAAYAEELSEQEMTKQEAAEVLEQEPTEQGDSRASAGGCNRTAILWKGC